MEVITLDESETESCKNDSVELMEQEVEEVGLPNLSMQQNSTIVNFEDTLPPGAAPEGFIVIDEEIENTSIVIEKLPIFKVIFRDDEVFQKYQTKIEHFFKNLLQNCYDEKKTVTNNLTIEIYDCNDDDSNFKHPLQKKEEEPFFTLDSNPKKPTDFNVPVYGKAKFNKILEKGKEKVSEKKDDSAAPKLTCFNCLGNHSMRDCTKPKNYGEINKNRKDYFNVRRGPSNARYHLDEDQKFGHFIPGQLSTKLCKALGLKDKELPVHIYRMRVLGYPPGWLEEARLQHSGLTLFDSDGIADQGSDEEGEIIAPGDKDQYDIKKIIDFPGFNIPPPLGTKDEFLNYWGSMEQLKNSKEAMETVLIHKKVDDGYKRKKFPNPSNSKPEGDISLKEMEIDTVEETTVENVPVKDLFIPPLPKENISETQPPPPPQEDDVKNNSMTTSSRQDSPTLFDLECAKKQLLVELNDSNSQSNLVADKTNEINENSLNENINTSDTKIEIVSKSESLVTNNLDTSNNETPKNSPKPDSVNKKVKAVHIGTPILQSCSPFNKLPTSEKFSKDICDVINFENLPDATGKYERMTELLTKVRRKLSDLQKE